jgi:hypothetical protein
VLAAEVTRLISHVSQGAAPRLAGGQVTVLEALRDQIVALLAALDNTGLTSTSRFSARVRGGPGSPVDHCSAGPYSD